MKAPRTRSHRRQRPVTSRGAMAWTFQARALARARGVRTSVPPYIPQPHIPLHVLPRDRNRNGNRNWNRNRTGTGTGTGPGDTGTGTGTGPVGPVPAPAPAPAPVPPPVPVPVPVTGSTREGKWTCRTRTNRLVTTGHRRSGAIFHRLLILKHFCFRLNAEGVYGGESPYVRGANTHWSRNYNIYCYNLAIKNTKVSPSKIHFLIPHS